MNSLHTTLIGAAFALLGAGNEPLNLKRKGKLHQQFDFHRLLTIESPFGKEGKTLKGGAKATEGRDLKSNPAMQVFYDRNNVPYIKTPRGQVVRWTESKAARLERAAAKERMLCNL